MLDLLDALRLCDFYEELITSFCVAVRMLDGLALITFCFTITPLALALCVNTPGSAII